ncbi:TonB family protein [Oleispirillum naphthae]|uniref:energy transducer TonB n=1 Tax=Oleispirillum naphthae TaxID=2838853 RepID=UPI0030823152
MIAAGEMRLWSASLMLTLGLHAGAALGLALLRSAPVNDMPAGAFSLELAAFGGNTAAAAGGGAKAAPAPAPQPKDVEPPKPKPVEKAEAALPKPEPKPKHKPKPQPKPVAAAPKPAPESAPPAAPASAAASSAGNGGAAGLAGEAGQGGGVISGRLGGGGIGAGTPLGRYKLLVFQALWQSRKYPDVARRMGYQGDVEVEFSVAANGEILASRLVAESGHGVLDREAKALLHRVRRFPPFPHDLHRTALTFRVTIPFRLT